MTTQPILPAPIAPSPIERAYIDDTPADLWPINQDSNFGIHRKIFCDTLMDVANQLQTIFNEIFAATSVQYLDHWEEQVGLPIKPTGLTVAQRQARVIGRSRRGAFTRSMRQQIVENYITATFGTAPVFGNLGIALGSGIPLYSGQNSLVGTYAIRENWPEKNLLVNSNFETDVSSWIASGATIVRDTTYAKYGSASAKVTINVVDQYVFQQIALSGATAGRTYTVSAWIYADAAAVGKAISIYLFAVGGATATAGSQTAHVLTAGWQRVSATYTLAQNDRTGIQILIQGQVTAGWSFWFDGAQIELGALSDYSDASGPPFFYEVRLLNTLGVDLNALNRELLRVTPSGISFAITQTASP